MILAVESSCDETAVAIVDENARIFLDFKYSQIPLHKEYGGVVPELASRSHFDVLTQLEKAITSASVNIKDIRAIAATTGPGLVGPLLVGSNFALGLAKGWNKPFIGVHHLRGHIASSVMSAGFDPKLSIQERAEILFPTWVLLVSGGHCQVLIAEKDLICKTIKTTSDDAAGECFDKCAKMLGLDYPGGPLIEKYGLLCTSQQLRQASEWAAALPRPKSAEGFSFSGLKTAFRLLIESLPQENLTDFRPPLCRALEMAVSDSLLSVLKRAYEDHENPPQNLISCGGVSANLFLRKQLENFCKSYNIKLYLVPLDLSTDNAVMIALAAYLQSDALNLKQVFARARLDTSL